MYDLIIIGAGPAGLTAAIYGGRAGLKTLLLEMAVPGGQAGNTHLIENYPGFPDGISGPDLMELFLQQAQRWGAEFKTAQVTALEDDGDVKKVVAGGEVFIAKTVLVASGSKPKPLGIPGEKEFHGRGVSYCGTCDGPFFRDREIAVVGGGSTALQETEFLRRFAKKINLIHRRDRFRGENILAERVKADEKVELFLNCEVKAIEGNGRVERLHLYHNQTGEETEMPVEGIFFFVGYAPYTDFCRGVLDLDEQGNIVVAKRMAASRPGFFAAGDVVSKDFYQVATAVGEGALAIKGVEEFLSAH